MIEMNYLKGFFAPEIAENVNMQKHILKEYVELLSLDWLSRSQYADQLVFIGGTNLRLVQGIDRFSEDLDFDCKNLSVADFNEMTNNLVAYLRLQGFIVETHDKLNTHLTAFRRNIYFPELLFSLQLTGHREERFLMKVEAQDQGIDYKPEQAIVRRMDMFFPVAVPPLGVLLAMKLSALLARQKGRDFYDVMFLIQRTKPDYDFLAAACNVNNKEMLLERLNSVVAETDMNLKKRDFEHLLFNPRKSEQILLFIDVCEQFI